MDASLSAEIVHAVPGARQRLQLRQLAQTASLLHSWPSLRPTQKPSLRSPHVSSDDRHVVRPGPSDRKGPRARLSAPPAPS